MTPDLRYGFGAWTILLVALALQMPPATAQQSGVSEGIELEEIVVTARRRDESLLDVPVTISAFSADQIAGADMLSIRDLSRLTPAFNFSDLGARYVDSPVIRGIAGNDADPTKQSASFFLDGVYISGSAVFMNMHDVERVEVLKGPQSAQFGRATFAGAINFITKEPTNEYEGKVTAKAAEHDEWELSREQLPFAERLTKVEAGRIIAVQAEDHYIRVHTDDQDELIYYKFSEAADELSRAGLGMRVHRSFWVSNSAVSAIARDKTGYRLQLVNGADVPVGRSYVEAARIAGLIAD